MYLTQYICCFRCKNCRDVVVTTAYSTSEKCEGEILVSKVLESIWCRKPGAKVDDKVEPMIFCPNFAPAPRPLEFQEVSE